MNAVRPHPDYAPLRWALLANAAFSLLSGASFIFVSATIAHVVGTNVPAPLVMSIGAALLPFGAFTAWVATRRHPSTFLALLISVADLTWVLGSCVLLALARDVLSRTGLALVAAVALSVLGFAIGQLRGIARVYRSNPGNPRRIRVCIEVCTPGDAETIWRNVADMGNISRFAPMLATSAMRNGEPPRAGAVRECSDHAQRRWAERCLRFDSAQRELDVEFLAEEPGFPFPFQALRGGWRVQPASSGAVVTIWWEGTLRHAALAFVVPPLLAWQAQRQFAVVVSRMSVDEWRKTAMTPKLLSVVPC